MKRSGIIYQFIVICVSCSLRLSAQVPGGVDFFDYPMKIMPKLNANFGEMRPNHFHMGLDLSTESRENVPVYAPADGYVSRIKIELNGFGRAIYLNHPNGTTTLYAHMNKFLPEAEDFYRAKQYELKNWKVDLNLTPDLIAVKKGQLIGYSGNTGSSQGPHVHFEIRDTKTENCLNPLQYNFSLKDNTPPDLFRIAFYNKDKSVYEQQPILVLVTKKGNVYTAGEIQLPFERALVAIQATDRITGFSNQNGIYSASVYSANRMLSGFSMDNISYDDTRGLNGHIDYLTKLRGGPYYQMLFPPKAYKINMYKGEKVTGYLEVSQAPRDYQIRVSDINGNVSALDFRLSLKQAITSPASSRPFQGQLIQPGQVNIYETDLVQFVFPEYTFYDQFPFQVKTIFAQSSSMLSSTFQTLPDFIPVNNNFTIRIKPNRNTSIISKERVVVRRTYRAKSEVKKAVPEKGWFTASFRDFGFFQLIEDLEPPTLVTNIQNGMVLRKGMKLTLKSDDNMGVVSEVKLLADGVWLLVQPTWNGYVYIVDENFPAGEHKLTAIVKDEAGNTLTREWKVSVI